MSHPKIYDVIIIGGSYAGLSAAMSLGRSLRHVLIIDSGIPCNRKTPQTHNFITHDGETPGHIAEKAREQVLKYSTVALQNALAIKGQKTEQGFDITIKTGERFSSKKLIFATGIKDLMPDIKGFTDCWGITAIHCPYCHGYESRNQKTAIMANGERAFHLASLVNNLTDSLCLLTNGEPDFSAEQLAKLKKNNIPIIEKKVVELQHTNGLLNRVVFSDGEHMELKAVYTSLPIEQHSDIPEALGCELTEHGFITVDEFQRTTIQGVFACGDTTTMMRSVANAVATGNLTGAIVNKELTDEQF